MKAKWPQGQGQEMDIFFFKWRFHASQVHGTPQKNTKGIIYIAEITPLNSFQHYSLHLSICPIFIHLLVQLCNNNNVFI